MNYKVLIAAPLLLAACETTELGKGVQGGLIGGLAGAAACAVSGANDTECALLILGGAFAGYAIANYIDKDDSEAYQLASKSVLEGETKTSTQTSAVTGNAVTVSAVDDGAYFQNAAGETCTKTGVAYKGTDHQDTWCKGSNGKWTLQTA